jgi:hypothetical protein
MKTLFPKLVEKMTKSHQTFISPWFSISLLKRLNFTFLKTKMRQSIRLVNNSWSLLLTRNWKVEWFCLSSFSFANLDTTRLGILGLFHKCAASLKKTIRLEVSELQKLWIFASRKKTLSLSVHSLWSHFLPKFDFSLWKNLLGPFEKWKKHSATLDILENQRHEKLSTC